MSDWQLLGRLSAAMRATDPGGETSLPEKPRCGCMLHQTTVSSSESPRITACSEARRKSMVGSVSTIRTAVRVLQVLAALNAEHPAGAALVARRLQMSRATTYRFLETLVDAGYALKDPVSGHYSPSQRVRSLSCGFEDEQWLAEVARPVMQAIGRELIWPLAISTLSGLGMQLRETTDMQSPLAINRVAPGRRISLLGSAAGRVYLAFCGAEQRETLLDILSTSGGPEDVAITDRAAVHRDLAAVREAGFALNLLPQRVTQQCALAVPVFGNERVLASLSIRYADSALRRSVALQRFVPKLQKAAGEIGRAFEMSVAAAAK
ncbi:MAG: helix-turn-helix domain-containing protein [Sinobacteraceae bacterium]|nr:helix-turn-helix domain-containing protein [Nevskiaceae bacterium]